jgi:hypothetical protein
MSVVLVVAGRYATVRTTVGHLAAQTVAHQLELVLVAPTPTLPDLEAADLAPFAAWQIVAAGPLDSTARARAAGIRAARAPLVALTEDHAFPAPDWAAALITAHAGPWAAVGPAFHNANPDTLVSWVNLLIEYTPWLAPLAAAPAAHLPGHNSSYKRALLLAYGDRLPALLDAESVLHWSLRANGHQLYLEPAARTYHLNFSTPLAWLPLRFQGGRLFAGCRARAWPLPRRALYALGAPLIPLVRLVGIVRRLRTSGDPHGLLPRILPLLALGLAADAAGEQLGYLTGPGDAARRVSDLETDRARYLSAADRRAQTRLAGRIA